MNEASVPALKNPRIKNPQGSAKTIGRPRDDVPEIVKKQIGMNIRRALEDEHMAHVLKLGEDQAFSVIRFCEASEIPYTTVIAWINGRRNISIYDLLEVARFTKVKYETLLHGVPSVVEMRELAILERAQAMARRIAEQAGQQGLLFDEAQQQLDELTRYFPQAIRQKVYDIAGLTMPAKEKGTP